MRSRAAGQSPLRRGRERRSLFGLRQPAAALKSPQPAAAMVIPAREETDAGMFGDFVAIGRAAGCTEGKRQQAAAVQGRYASRDMDCVMYHTMSVLNMVC
jgi:hypothetical protein